MNKRNAEYQTKTQYCHDSSSALQEPRTRRSCHAQAQPTFNPSIDRPDLDVTPIITFSQSYCSSSRRREIMKLVAVAFFIAFFIAQDKASALVITSFSYCKSILTIDLIVSGPQSVNISSGDHAYFNCTATAAVLRWEINNVIFNSELIDKGFQELSPLVLNQSQNLIMKRLKVQGSALVDNSTLTCVALLETSPGMYEHDNRSALLLVQGTSHYHALHTFAIPCNFHRSIRGCH